ncbi:hypothetical protein GCM10011491_30840 [Brucella endophytica]|uniref:Uncharacterized protein n=1 Tax=Brucella endophytica TaxID=1963359 RepID=A0A916SH11_9HYPH|nr:hypothetical protein [Brucella endophytica]GGB00470.1 hypothetical protein GCM10011491_30840 [Brucella endophytica]
MKYGSFIDPPSPFSPLEEWEAFAADLRSVGTKDPDVKRELDRAEKMIAEMKAQRAS